MSAAKDLWPFADPRKVAVITTRSILNGDRPILRVTHDEDDGAWQFLDGSSPDEREARVVSLEEMTRVDPGILGLADLPLGWTASRTSPTHAWVRVRQPVQSPDLYLSSLSERGVGAVSEEDDGVGFFYLFDDTREDGQKVITACKVCPRDHGLREGDLDLVWDRSDTKIALVIRGAIWAVYDTETLKGFHSEYQAGFKPRLGQDVLEGF